MPSHPSAERHSRIMPLAVLCLLGGISKMIGGVADGYGHDFGALRDLHGGNRYRRPWPKQVNSIYAKKNPACPRKASRVIYARCRPIGRGTAPRMIHADRRTRNLAWLPPQRPSSSIRKPSVYPGITQAKRSETGPVACELPAPADSLWRLIALTVFGRRGPGLLEARHG